MTYPIVKPPFSGKFRELGKKEIRIFYAWFMEQIPLRIAILESTIRESESFEGWKADFSVDSLDPLGMWFISQVTTRTRPREVMDELIRQIPYPIDLENWELTEKTFSLAFDIGIYFAETLRKHHPYIKWDLIITGSKRYMDYGHPILKGMGILPLNPVHIIVTLAYGIARHKKSEERMHELYDIWASILSKPPAS